LLKIGDLESVVVIIDVMGHRENIASEIIDKEAGIFTKQFARIAQYRMSFTGHLIWLLEKCRQEVQR